jgi:hypothetical protein
MSIVSFGARANWEYGVAGGGRYDDDGARLSIAFRGGISMPFASVQNDLGSIVINYWTSGGQAYTGDNTCGGASPCDYFGRVDLGKLPATNNYDSFAWVGGAAVGMTVGGSPNLRIEMDWLHIAEANYNANPLFAGNVEMAPGIVMENAVASARSTVATDIVSAMFYYDFFGGMAKPARSVIPYVGAGLGYATSTTVLTLTDNYGDLSPDVSFGDFGNQNGVIIDFYTSQAQTNNFALSVAAGFAYGIDDGVFFDFGARASFVPKIRWALNNGADSNATTSKERDIFSAGNIIFVNAYAGVRFEF